MKLDEAEREIFDEIQQEFVNEFSEAVLFGIYKMHRKLSKQLGLKNFPISDLKDLLLFNMLQAERFKGMQLHDIFLCLQDEFGIKEWTFYKFYHSYCIPLKNEERKRLPNFKKKKPIQKPGSKTNVYYAEGNNF